MYYNFIFSSIVEFAWLLISKLAVVKMRLFFTFESIEINQFLFVQGKASNLIFKKMLDHLL